MQHNNAAATESPAKSSRTENVCSMLTLLELVFFRAVADQVQMAAFQNWKTNRPKIQAKARIPSSKSSRTPLVLESLFTVASAIIWLVGLVPVGSSETPYIDFLKHPILPQKRGTSLFFRETEKLMRKGVNADHADA